MINGSRSTPVTVADVARAASVSKATAARVLGGYGRSSEAARVAVTEAAARLGYQPNEVARAMSRGRTGLIGVVVGDIENAFFGRAVRGIGERARAEGFGVVITNASEQIEVERENVAMLLRQRVAGLIVSPADSRSVGHLQAAMDGGTPLVTLDRWVDGLDADCVCGADYDAASEVMATLRAAGHQRIAFVTAITGRDGRLNRLEDVTISAVRERLRGFLDGHPLGAAALSMIRTDAGDQDALDRIAADLLQQSVTAILSSDGLIGAHLITAMARAGARIPRDVSLVSWFDADWTRVAAPAVSVVDQPTQQFGELAVDRLIARINGDQGPRQRLAIGTPLIWRGSVGEPHDPDRPAIR